MTNANCIRVLSVDDHPLVREGIGTIINCQADMSLAGTYISIARFTSTWQPTGRFVIR